MNDSPDTVTDDLGGQAITLLSRIIEGKSAEDGPPAAFIACAVVQLMRATELRLQLGEGTFELLLEEFRQRLVEFCRGQDNVVDLDDDRFFLVLPDLTSIDHLELATAKLKRTLSPPIAIVNHSVLVQTNAGFSVTRFATARAELLYRAAESALSRCTPAERYVVCDPASIGLENDSWSLKVDLEEALHRGELVPWFEPVYSTAFQNVIAGASTLAWNSPRHGLQGFSKFITRANDCEMLRPVYWQYLKGAIGQAHKWQETVGVVVPLPAQLLADDEVTMQLFDALDLYSVTPERLTIEVPEAVLGSPDSRVILEGIRHKKIGVRIAGMGEGGMPLVMLGSLPIDEVAVSRTLLTNSVPPALRTLIFELFKRAGYRMIATGIKEEKLLPRLKEFGFHAVQGAAVGEILPYNDFAGWLKKKVGT